MPLSEQMKKPSNVTVTARECRGNHERMIRRFIKKCKKERIIEQVKERRYHKKPSVAKKEKSIKAQRQRARDQQKRARAKERRNRRK
tara:strand:- start:1036 stop:1296 length:261 start_codon:yes stop_codon:yes gene_type:complete